MKFLIVYDKDNSKLLEQKQFTDKEEARDAFREAYSKHADKNYDVSLIDTENEETLRKTWARYFHKPFD